jgi:hypothetical protein
VKTDLRVGDVVRWKPDAESTMVTFARPLVKKHPVMLVDQIVEVAGLTDAIVRDAVTRKIVKRQASRAYDAQFPHPLYSPKHWDEGFFVTDPFLTAAHKAQKKKK